MNKNHLSKNAHRFAAAVLTLTSVGLLPLSAQNLLGVDGNGAAHPRRVGSYALPEARQVSLGIFNAEGQLVRTLASGESAEPGTYAVEWDGLDRAGQPVAPGSYEWRMVGTPGFQARFLAQVGVGNPKSPDWRPWIGNHTGPSGLAADGSAFYFGATQSENAPVMLKLDAGDGEQIATMGQLEVNMGPRAIGVAAGHVFMLQQNRRLVKLAPETLGRVTHWDMRHENEKETTYHPGEWPDTVALGAGGDTLVLSYQNENLIRFVDPGTGGTVQEIPVHSPKGIAVGEEGEAYVISGGGIERIGPEGTRTPIVGADTLEDPFRIAYEPVYRHLLVTERETQQVLRFDLNGRLVKTYGRKGGRAFGDYVATDFRGIRHAIAADHLGGFLVAEGGVGGTIPRIVQIDKNGDLVNEWHGGQDFYSFTGPDPENPTRLFMAGRGVTLVMDIDLQTGHWSVRKELEHSSHDGLFPDTFSWRAQWHPRYLNGELHLVSAQPRAVGVFRVDEKGGRLLPAAAVRFTPVPGSAAWREAVAHHGYETGDKAPTRFAWSDQNGDGEFQPKEFTFNLHGKGIPALSMGSMQASLDDNWNLRFPARLLPKARSVAGLLLPNTAAEGAMPRWDWDRVEVFGEIPEDIRARVEAGAAGNIEGMFTDTDGSVYGMLHGNVSPGQDRHGESWPGAGLGNTRLLRWDEQGRLLWSTGRHATQDPHEVFTPTPGGDMHWPTRILGTFRNTVVMADKAATPAMVYTDDGLFAGTFLDRRAEDAWHDAVYHWWKNPVGRNSTMKSGPIPFDCLVGGAFAPIEENRVLWTVQGNQGNPVYVVQGWEGWIRRQGSFVIDAVSPRPAAEGEGLRASYFDNRELSGDPAVEQIDARLWFEQAEATGKTHTADWREGPGGGRLNPERFSVRWTGYLEAPLSEDFRFTPYVPKDAGARMWLNGELVLDDWASGEGGRRWMWWRGWGNVHPVRWESSEPVRLEAGRLYSIRVEFFSEVAKPSFSLNWESGSIDRQRIPREFLYPVKPGSE